MRRTSSHECLINTLCQETAKITDLLNNTLKGPARDFSNHMLEGPARDFSNNEQRMPVRYLSFNGTPKGPVRDFRNANVNMLLQEPVKDFSHSIHYTLEGLMRDFSGNPTTGYQLRVLPPVGRVQV